MERSDWLLLFIAQPVSEDDKEPQAVDPVRIMKGMFYFAVESSAPMEEKYQFEPYHLGPVSFEIYDDLNHLLSEQLIAAQDVPGETWKRYFPTSQGAARAAELKGQAHPELLEQLKAQKVKVSSLSFIDLLRRVYQEHPEFTGESLFRFD